MQSVQTNDFFVDEWVLAFEYIFWSKLRQFISPAYWLGGGLLKPIFKKNDGITLENLPFDFNQHYYVDASHYNKKATEIIANGIFEYIYW